jgi:NADH-quinone oxidoreductase subunit N
MNDVLAVLPLSILLLSAVIVLAFERIFGADERAAAWLAAAGALGAAAAAAIVGAGDDALGGVIRRDGAAVFMTAVLCASAAAAGVLLAGLARRAHRPADGRLVLMLDATAGATLMTVAADLLLLLMAVAVLFLSLLALIAGSRSPESRAATRSFLVLGGTALGFFGAGVGLIWWESGSPLIGALSTATSSGGQAGVALVLASLACFAGLVPFHFWLPAALASVPAPIAALIAILPRVAAFAALLRCAGAITAGGESAIDWRACVAILAAASLALGCVSAISEGSLKRLLGYLTITYAGQIAVAAAAGAIASAAIALALVAYAVVVIGLFGVAALIPSEDPRLVDLRGVARTRPLLVAALAVLVIGMAGLPPTVVFFARLAVFESAVSAQLAWLVILAGVATVVTAASSARVLFAALEVGPDRLSSGRVASAVVVLAAVIAIAGGIAPRPLLELAQSVRF